MLSNHVSALSHELHPSVLEDLGLEIALANLIEDFKRAHNFNIGLSLNLPEPVALPIATAIFRITQEALRNVAKHAPGSRINILASQVSQRLQLLVEDTGPGFDLKTARARGGLGIVSMRERARQIGGTFEIRSSPGEGTRIKITVPLKNRRIDHATGAPAHG